ncbi:hypothetical protein M885DRAFT_584673 [Pelagophyceae sp. CCMP2097]|nr:hypothetical protein M885DRAFT_584673 [Pelagophyceae sp. CCMP2097]|mmetsp:Transcript_16523/g.55781  ORF Transcript_16523/g.55781 Transcript_16523/m.55781 type:complete len:494 (-) Transcript_16523:106-1587(-)
MLQASVQMVERAALVLAVYCGLDYILGFVATKVLEKVVFRDMPPGSFGWRIKWVAVHWGVTELTVTVGPVVWANPHKFKETPFFLRIRRMSVRLKPASLYSYLRGGKAAVDVRNVEAEGITIHLERHAKQGLNVWAALGCTEVEFEAKLATSQQAHATDDFDECDDVDVAEFDECDVATGPPNTGPPSAAEAPAVQDGLLLDVRRVCIRDVNLYADAFLGASKTAAAVHAKQSAIQIRTVELQHRELKPRPARRLRLGRAQPPPPPQRDGLTIEEVVNKAVWRVVDEVVRQNPLLLVKSAGGAAFDHGVFAAKAAMSASSSAAQAFMLNATHSQQVRVHDRLRGLESPTVDDQTGAIMPRELVVVVLGAKHLQTSKGDKPSAYVKVQIGKKGVKAKTAVRSATKSPQWDETIHLSPVESLNLDVRIQVYSRRIFGEDEQLGETIRLPLRTALVVGVERKEWFVIQTKPDCAVEITKDADGTKAPAIQLSLLLQ